MLNIALPKGRLGDQVYRLFSGIGYECPALLDDNRKLVFENPERRVRYLLVKPTCPSTWSTARRTWASPGGTYCSRPSRTCTT